MYNKVEPSMNEDSYKAVWNWIYRFLLRKSLAIRRPTHVSQTIPEGLQDKIFGFIRDCIKVRREHQFPLERIYNCDETAIYLLGKIHY